MLKYISQNCPWIVNCKVTFVDNRTCPGYSNIIERDLRELISTLSTNTWKASLLLIGSTFEALLYCFLKRNEYFIQWSTGFMSYQVRSNDWLLDYLRTFRRFLGAFDMDYLPDYIIDYRNIIHTNNEINQTRIDVSENTVRQAVLLLNRLIKDFEEFKY